MANCFYIGRFIQEKIAVFEYNDYDQERWMTGARTKWKVVKNINLFTGVNVKFFQRRTSFYRLHYSPFDPLPKKIRFFTYPGVQGYHSPTNKQM